MLTTSLPGDAFSGGYNRQLRQNLLSQPISCHIENPRDQPAVLARAVAVYGSMGAKMGLAQKQSS